MSPRLLPVSVDVQCRGTVSKMRFLSGRRAFRLTHIPPGSRHTRRYSLCLLAARDATASNQLVLFCQPTKSTPSLGAETWCHLLICVTKCEMMSDSVLENKSLRRDAAAQQHGTSVFAAQCSIPFLYRKRRQRSPLVKVRCFSAVPMSSSGNEGTASATYTGAVSPSSAPVSDTRILLPEPSEFGDGELHTPYRVTRTAQRIRDLPRTDATFASAAPSTGRQLATRAPVVAGALTGAGNVPRGEQGAAVATPPVALRSASTSFTISFGNMAECEAYFRGIIEMREALDQLRPNLAPDMVANLVRVGIFDAEAPAVSGV